MTKQPAPRVDSRHRSIPTTVWASGRVCPHCGNADQDKLTKLEGKVHRPGVYQCNEPQCRQQFTVTVNTEFERSKIPLLAHQKWKATVTYVTAIVSAPPKLLGQRRGFSRRLATGDQHE